MKRGGTHPPLFIAKRKSNDLMNHLCKTLLGAALLAGSLAANAQGLEGIIVEDYYTISAADADYLNNTVGATYPINAGAKVYRIYVDMAPNYKLNTVSGSPLPQGGGVSPNPLDFTTTTTFWNEDGFGTEVPPQTARLDDGAAFDSYITIGLTGRSGGAVGCGANTQQVGTLKTADTNGNLTLCSVYSGFPSGAGTPDGNIPPTSAVPALTYNLGGLIDFSALTADGSVLEVIGDAWATLPNGPGVDPSGTNRVLIAQLTTDGDLSFHINVQLQTPDNSALETYVWQTAGAGEVVSPFLTYPSAGTPDCLGVIGGPALPGTACNDNNVCTTNDVWSQACVCAGTPDNTDSDGDGTPNCSDNCPNVAGQQGSACNDNNACTINDVLNASCACVGTPDNTDTDGDGTPNCSDNCPNVAGQQGSACNDNNACTTNDVLNASCVCAGTTDNTDTDGDGVPNCSDNCPNVTGQQGSACDDNNALTINDVLNANCICIGTPVGCVVAGDCNDQDACTSDACVSNACVYTPITTDTDGDGTPDCSDNCPNVAGQQGSTCDDGNALTVGDVLNANCVCIGTPVGCVVAGDCDDQNACTSDACVSNACVYTPITTDTDGDGTPDCSDNCPNVTGTQGSACNDNNPCTTNDVLNASCVCTGTPDNTDTDGDGIANCSDNCPAVVGQVGSSCDDGNALTVNDVLNNLCICVGTSVGCVVNGDCNDQDPCTEDACVSNACVFTPTADTDGDGTCDAIDGCPADAEKIAAGLCGCGNPEPGTTCDDGNANTTNDQIGTNCICAGTVIGVDCEGTPGGSALPGTACDDGNANTGNDTWSASCVCEGQTLDCLGVPGGTAVIGSACNDGNACTTGDVYDASCACAGTFQDTDGDGLCNANDNCPNVAGQIGSACDDGNANTINDVLNANCACQGTPVGGCTENLTLSITLDANGSQTSWTLYDAAEVGVLDQGGPYSNGTPGAVITEDICVPAGCYHLRFSDSGNDGITGGGYVLRNANNKRIIDASVGSFTTTSELGGVGARTFCVPIGGLNILNNWCDRSNLLITSPVYCSSQPGATGYQFWIYDAHGSYNRRVTRPVSNLAPVNLNTNPIPTNTWLNIRVKPVFNGVPSEFGPACRVRFLPNSAGREMLYDDGSVVTLNLFPNPNRDGLVTMSLEGLDVTDETPAVIEIFDLLGSRVIAERTMAAEGTLNHRLELTDRIGAGLYMVHVTIEGQRYTQRLVIQ